MRNRLSSLPNSIWWGSAAALAAVLLLAVVRPQGKPRPAPSTPQATAASSQAVSAGLDRVAALGRLEPAGDVRTLAAPIGGMGASPRLASLLVKEGDWVRRGQVLASFDNRPGLLAERQLLLARISSLQTQVKLMESQTARYRSLARSAINPANDLDMRELQLSDLRGRLNEARAALRKLNTDLALAQLVSPIDGVVLSVFTQPGERPDSRGILEVGANQRMEAVAEVYESDIARIQPGQRVELQSESGGFRGTIAATVLRISPQVRQRQVLSTDPSADADARIVEVRLAIAPEQSQRLRNLAGLKVVARFDP